VAAKAGSTASGKARLKLKIQVTRGVRMIALELAAKDEIGNMRQTTRRLKLPR
jgi:hypothetical protein